MKFKNLKEMRESLENLNSKEIMFFSTMWLGFGILIGVSL